MSHPFTVVRYPGFILAWSDEWPGMLCGAATEAAVAESMPRSLAEYRAWLRSHNERGPEGTDWHASETVDGVALDARDGCLAADLAPLSPTEFERYLAHARLAQEDLVRAATLPDELLDWRPEGLTIEHPDPWAPDVRTIRGILTHALQLGVFYREGLKDGPAAGIFEAVGTAAEETGRTRELLAVAAAAGLNRLYHPVRPGGSSGEWTMRKVLRRLISHDRAHAAEIVQRRTWLLPGVPGSPKSKG